MSHRSDMRFCSKNCRYSANSEKIQAAKGRRWRASQPPAAVAAFLAKRREAWRIARQALIRQFWDAQDGRCYLCGDPLPEVTDHEVHLDHDHGCCRKGTRGCAICRRGLACLPCNLLIGYGKDDPDRLRRIADGLEAASAAVRERMAAAPRQGTLL